MGYVLFENEEDAKLAIEETNNTFIGKNRITVVLYKNIQQRIKENADVRVLGLPRDWTPEKVEEYFSNELGMDREDIFKSAPYVASDKRPGEIHSNDSMAIFTCVDVETSKKIIDAFKDKKVRFDGVNDNMQVGQRLTREMADYVKATEQKENQQKFAQSGKNVQVFGLPIDITDEQVREFFSRYGEIESLSSAKRGEHVNETIFHYNILFKTVEAATSAINNSANDEKNMYPRLSREGLRVLRYQDKAGRNH